MFEDQSWQKPNQKFVQSKIKWPDGREQRSRAAFISQQQQSIWKICAILFFIFFDSVNASKSDDLIILPHELLITEARDTSEPFIDLNVFNRFYTFQTTYEGNETTNTVTQIFDPKNQSPWKKHNKDGSSASGHSPINNKFGENDLVLRLRASLKGAEMDSADQGMRVSIIELTSGDRNPANGKIIIDGSSEDMDQRNVHLDTVELSSEKTYLFKYEFFQKTIAKHGTQKNIISTGHMGLTSSSRPFVSQQLSITSKQLLETRAQAYINYIPKTSQMVSDLASKEKDVSLLPQDCDFSPLQNRGTTLKSGEAGISCKRTIYNYRLSGQAPNDLNTIFEKKFTIDGAEHEPVTYLFDMIIGYEFAYSAQLKALIRRIDPDGAQGGEYIYDPLICLYDHSCVVADLLNKNEMSLNVILTSGEYEFIIFDQQENDVRSFLTRQLSLNTVPFSLELQVTPLFQNEERQMCGDMIYLAENFIQNRFIEGRNGEPFVFDDQVILSLLNFTQRVNIKPEEDMVLKVASKEAYGVNLIMELCDSSNNLCAIKSSKVGNYEVLFAAISKSREYYLKLSYKNSIIQISNFFDCPNVHISIAMLTQKAAQQKISDQKNIQNLAQLRKDSDLMLADLFNTLSKPISQTDVTVFSNDMDTIYTFDASEDHVGQKASGHIIASRDFTIAEGSSQQLLIEIFYDAYLYDLEILVVSKDATEVRAHKKSSLNQQDALKYKGLKRLQTKLEHGDYTFHILSKHPGSNGAADEFSVAFYQFQLLVVLGQEIPPSKMQPKSLNLLGMLGPHGNGFGQFVYYLPEVFLLPSGHLDLFFTLNEPKGNEKVQLTGHPMLPSIDVQVIDVNGHSESIDLSLEEIQEDGNQKNPSTNKVQIADDNNIQNEDEMGQKALKAKGSERMQDDWEEGVEYESLTLNNVKTGVKYRLRLKNRDPSDHAETSFKLVITEYDPKRKSSRSGDENLPKSIDEVKRVKPAIPGMKQTAFLQGSKAIYNAFQIGSITPFIPKSDKIYQGVFKTGPNQEDSFMKSLEFNVDDESVQIFAQVMTLSGRDDLFITLYSLGDGDDEPKQVGRSFLGKYANALGPVTITRGNYRLLVHPDLESKSEKQTEQLIRFHLDVLLESQSIGLTQQLGNILEEVALCNIPTLPVDYNGPGFLHPLSGNNLQIFGKFRVTEVLEGGTVKFYLPQPSLVVFYLDLPEGLSGKAELKHIDGTHTTVVQTKELNRNDETFLRQEEGFKHRGVIQFRDFLSSGKYQIKIEATDSTQWGQRTMPRCEPYHTQLLITPLNKTKTGYHIGEDCLNSQYIQERLVFDSVQHGKLIYPTSENVVDVSYIDLKRDGEGPFLFFYQIQHDPRLSGVIGISLSKFDQQTNNFQQVALYGSTQDGVTQLFTIIETGTYAVGIQTLTSTPSMYTASGLSGKTRIALKSQLLPETCVHLSYTYLIASSLKHDGKVIEGGPFALIGLIMGGGMQKMMQSHRRDVNFLNEIGDNSDLNSCVHDDLPQNGFPVGETGFDVNYVLLVQEKNYDIIDLVVETDSFFRLHIHSKNPMNQIKAYVYDAETSDIHSKPIFVSQGSRQTQTILGRVTKQKKSYKIKIEYDSLDEDDDCPRFHLRAILEPILEIADFLMKCNGAPLPPNSIKVTDDDVLFQREVAFPSDFVDKAMEHKHKHADLTYDMVLDWPGANPNETYYVDVETISDFLVSQISFELLYEHPDRSLRTLGRSEIIQGTPGGTKHIERLKLLDKESELADDLDISGAILRLRLPQQGVEALALAKRFGTSKENEELCHNFKLSIRIEKRNVNQNGAFGHSSDRIRLMRIRWEGTEVQHDLFDSRDKLTAVLEFDRSMQGNFAQLKGNDFAVLLPTQTGQSGSQRAQPDVVKAVEATMFPDDPSTIIITFEAGSLARGWCHALQFAVNPFMRIDMDEKLLGDQLKLCTTNCLCDKIGSHGCDEVTGECLCRHPHTGVGCSDCIEGHFKDPITGTCNPISKCATEGGTVDCNGHGICSQHGGEAICKCNPGFKHDGLDQCARCSDPLFTYPNCQTRSFIIEEPEIQCRLLSGDLPVGLYKEHKAYKEGQPVQSDDGTLNWAHRYKLHDDQGILIGQSTHYFKIGTASILRLFIDSAQTKVLFKYRIFNHKNEQLITSSFDDPEDELDGYVTQDQEFLIVHQPEGQNPVNAPYRLEIEYEHINEKQETEKDQSCPVLDIKLLIEPFVTAESAVKCSNNELELANKPRDTRFDLEYSQTIEKHVTLRSGDTSLYKKSSNNQQEYTENHARIVYDLNIRNSGNALSILATYPFSRLHIFMTLYDSQGSIIGVDRAASLETKPVGSQTFSQESDTAIYFEEPRINAGKYQLEILIPTGLFLPTKQHETCLGFDLVIEYVKRHRREDGSSDEQNGEQKYEVLAIIPPNHEKLWTDQVLEVKVMLDRPYRLDDFVNNQTDTQQICQMVDKKDDRNLLKPKNVIQQGPSALALLFDFANVKISSGLCFKLVCSTKSVKEGLDLFYPIEEETNYCFDSDDQHRSEVHEKCNPHADPKLDDSGRCICASPYEGNRCEECSTGFKPQRSFETENSKKDHHVQCVIDLDHASKSICSSHGRAKDSHYSRIDQVQCICDEGFGGLYCDYCKDSERAYPACTEAFGSQMYNPEKLHQFLKRRKYDEHGYSTVASRYFSEDSLEVSVFNEECGWVDFPDNFDRTELMREFSSGEFHIADNYVINHRQDNIIKFVPKHVGIFKFLVQQPENNDRDAGPTESSYDIEIGIYDPHVQRFIASSMNSHLKLPSGTPVKLEHAYLNFLVTEDKLYTPLYVFFRTLNFTGEGESNSKGEGCQSVFIESEFRATNTDINNSNKPFTPCLNDPVLEPNKLFHLIDQQIMQSTHGLELGGWDSGRINPSGDEGGHSIDNSRQNFFTYQDFYLDGNQENDFDVVISLQQKFYELNTLDILIEILQTDIQQNEIDMDKHRPQIGFQSSSESNHISGIEDSQGRQEEVKGEFGPSCKRTCFVGGEKSYNEMIRQIVLSPKTYFRVWVFQQLPNDRREDSSWCANYQLFLKASPNTFNTQKEREISQKHRCTAEELPSSLNTERYLKGMDGKQKDFHYRQSYRVDHLWHNKAHILNFRLDEPTLIRVLAPLHRHLEFELILALEKGMSHTVLHRARREDHHITIFAQLAAGDYSLRLAFFSDASLLQMPCQQVQIEMAMTTVSRAQLEMNQIRNRELVQNSPASLTLMNLFDQSKENHQSMFRRDQIFVKDIKNIMGGRQTEQEDEQLTEKDLLIQIMKQGFEIAEDDDAGIQIDIRNDFLLTGINIALKNTLTGQLVEDSRHESSKSILVDKLHPGHYQLIIYTHTCLSNLEANQGIQSFDVLFEIKLRLIRHLDSKLSSTKEIKQISIQSNNGGSDNKLTLPAALTSEEIRCLKQYSHLPEQLDSNGVTGQLELIDTFFLPTHAFQSHQIVFTAHAGQDALRILLSKSNTKIAIFKQDNRQLIAQSRPVEEGRVQLLIVSQLQQNTKYVIQLEFTERAVSYNGELIGGGCEHFVMSIKSQSSNNLCVQSLTDNYDWKELSVNQDGEASTKVIRMKSKTSKKKLTIVGGGEIDLQITLDYSSSFYMPDLELHADNLNLTGHHEEEFWKKAKNFNAQEENALSLISHQTSPSFVDHSKKFQVTFLFTSIRAGDYKVRIHQRFKPQTVDCFSPVTMSVTAWKSGASQIWVEQGAIQGLNLFQSEREQNEQPRIASRLPINLRTYKFLGAEPKGNDQVDQLIFTGPIQFDERETENVILFAIYKDDTIVRFYIERTGTILTLEKLENDHGTVISTNGLAFYKRLGKGTYRVKIGHGTPTARQNAALIPPRASLTILIADQALEKEHNVTWSKLLEDGSCQSHSNFPLALRQQKQQDISQLYYNIPFVQVDLGILASSQILQSYNFRVNVTSRVYFEVGMHLLSQHVTLQFTSLNDNGYIIQGKQRGNLNVLDLEVGPGDYTLAIKQPTVTSQKSAFDTCGFFSMQGVVESLSLMKSSQNSGDIVQKGVTAECSETADNGDKLPTKIFGSKQQTKGGGELHIDARGHFIKQFRNVLFRTNDRSEIIPEYERIEIQVIEDSLMHLTFAYQEIGANVIRVLIIDTSMLSQGVPPSSFYKIRGLSGGITEFVSEYSLQKGHHYILSIYYEGSVIEDDEGRTTCQVYDLTLSISHRAQMIVDTRCTKGDPTPSLLQNLPELITESNLNHDGHYEFEETLRMHDPGDFSQVAKFKGQEVTPEKTFAQVVMIEMKNNYDLVASIEFEYNQAMYSLSLVEFGQERNGEEVAAVTSNEQFPLYFKHNNDRYLSVKRSLRADDVESKGQNKKHALVVTNMQPDIIPKLKQEGQMGLDGCLYVTVKIKIQSTRRSENELYTKQSGSKVAPMLLSTKPKNSPAFIQGRPTELSFDLIFNKQPYLKDKHYPVLELNDPETQAVYANQLSESLREAIKLKTMVVNIIDGKKQTILLPASQLYSNNKEYLSNEYHVGAVFDIAEFSGSGKEKLVHAQLVVEIEKITDNLHQQFEIESKMKARGLPIFVIEDQDTAQLINEEKKEVREALEESEMGKEAKKQNGLDTMTDQGDLEKKVIQIKKEEMKAMDKQVKPEVKCLCVHGKCRKGEATCSGGCDKGWSGRHCDTPSSQTLKNVVNDNSKDYTRDGLYKPKQISDERKTGGDLSKTQKSKNKAQSIQEQNDHMKVNVIDSKPFTINKPKRIDDEYPQNKKQEKIINTVVVEEKQQSSNKKFGMYALLAFLIYLLYQIRESLPCFKSSRPIIRRNGGQADNPFDNDSDDETELKGKPKMFELSNFTSNKDSSGYGSLQTDDDDEKILEKKEDHKFPLTSFNQPTKKEEVEVTGEELQRELEMFAGDSDEEEGKIKNAGGYSGIEMQPQSYEEDWGGEWNGNQKADELDELENYFDQKY